jgi:TPR repeat protein
MLKSAEKGNSDAQFWVAYKYFHGEGTKQSDKKTEEWLIKSVEQNNAMAQWLLGILYLEGKENDIDIKENKEYGIKLLEKSAEQGYEEAIKKLKDIQ